MLIKLITLGQKPPAWVTDGFQDYAKRLSQEFRLELLQLPTPKRQKSSDIHQLKLQEWELVQKNIPRDDLVIVLDERGKQLSTQQLAEQLKQWQDVGQNISIIIGGPDGLSAQAEQSANAVWSLSKLTLPHQLVKVIVAEQIYRAWSILRRHPYHRT